MEIKQKTFTEGAENSEKELEKENSIFDPLKADWIMK
jgi:hypothetical protein